MAGSSTETFEVIIIVILIIVLVIIVTMAIDFARRRRDCYTHPSPWCFKDWMCPNAPEGKRNVWDNLINAGLVGNRSQSACWALASDGTKPNQRNCPNVWPMIVGPNKRPADRVSTS